MPILGICYGEQVMAQQLGGKVVAGHSHSREFGRAEVEVLRDSPLFEGVWEHGRSYPVWMSHGDAVSELPPRLRAHRDVPLGAVRGHRRRGAPALWRAVSS